MNNIYDYLKQNMDGWSGRFTVAVTDMSEMEPGMVLATIHPEDRSGQTAEFYLHADGREEYTTMIGEAVSENE